MKVAHYHWIIQAHQMMTPDGSLVDNATVFVQADDEQMAHKRAKQLVKKKLYRTWEVKECFEDHELQAKMIKTQEQLVKLQRKAIELHGGYEDDEGDDLPFKPPRWPRDPRLQ